VRGLQVRQPGAGLADQTRPGGAGDRVDITTRPGTATPAVHHRCRAPRTPGDADLIEDRLGRLLAAA
jgi:hypothetical protein